MKFKRIMATLTAAVIVAGSSIVTETTNLLPSFSLTASAKDYEENGFSFTVENGKATIKGYKGSEENVIIPQKLGGYVVTAIGDNVFNQCSHFVS